MRYCQWFGRVHPEEIASWGAEAVALAEAGRSGASIVPGFVVSAEVYQEFFSTPEVKEKIETACRGLSVNKPQHFAGVGQDIRQIILKTAFVKETQHRINVYFKELEDRLVRQPGLGLRVALLGKERELIVNLKDGAGLAKALKQIYALAFEDQVFYQRLKSMESIVEAPYAVMIQYREKPEFSGVAVCRDLETPDENVIQIKASHFQRPPEGVVLEDIYRVDKKTLLLLSRSLSKHWWAEDGNGKHVSPPHLGRGVATLTDEQAVKIARQVKMAQAKFENLQEFAWVYAHDQFMITRVGDYQEELTNQSEDGALPLLIGLSGSLGWASGPTRLVKTVKDRQKIQNGDVVVVSHLKQSDFQWLAGAAALVTEAGGKLGVESKLARLLGAPAVLATGQALAVLREGQVITVDGTYGAVYAGVRPLAEQKECCYRDSLPVTGTKIYATVDDPHLVNKEILQSSDGIGLLRSEFILRLVGVHPQEIISRKLEEEYVEILAEGLESAVRAVYPRPVIYQLHDLTPDDLFGFRARHHNRLEPNPLIGYRGAHRLLAEPEVLNLELQALSELACKGLTNFSIMLPMARGLHEVEQMLAYIRQSKMAMFHHAGLWVKCETPALLIMMEKLCQQDIAGVCFDVPALSQLISGIDKGNYQIGHHLNEAEEATGQALAYAIEVCRQEGVSSMLTAESELLRPEIVQLAVEAGLTAVSVAPGQLEEAHGLIASIERKMVLDELLSENS